MSDSKVSSIELFDNASSSKLDPNFLIALIYSCPNAKGLSILRSLKISEHLTFDPSIFEGLALPKIEKLKFKEFYYPVFPFLDLVAERVLLAHPGNLKCISKISLSAFHPDAYQMIGDFLMRFTQIPTRLTEFKAVISEISNNVRDKMKQEP